MGRMFDEFDRLLRTSRNDVNWSEVGIFSTTLILERFHEADWEMLKATVLLAPKDWQALCIEALGALGGGIALAALFHILARGSESTTRECAEAIRVSVAFSSLSNGKKLAVIELANNIVQNPGKYPDTDLCLSSILI